VSLCGLIFCALTCFDLSFSSPDYKCCVFIHSLLTTMTHIQLFLRLCSISLLCLVRVYFPPVLSHPTLCTLCPNLQESELDSNKQSDSPSEEDPVTPRPISTRENPKYQLLLNNELKTNGLSGRDSNGLGGVGSSGEKSPMLSRWETSRLGVNNYRGSLESLTSRDWDTGSDRVGEADFAQGCVCDSAQGD